MFIVKVWVDVGDNSIILNASQRTCHDNSSFNITLPVVERNLYLWRKTFVFPQILSVIVQFSHWFSDSSNMPWEERNKNFQGSDSPCHCSGRSPVKEQCRLLLVLIKYIYLRDSGAEYFKGIDEFKSNAHYEDSSSWLQRRNCPQPSLVSCPEAVLIHLLIFL